MSDPAYTAEKVLTSLHINSPQEFWLWSLEEIAWERHALVTEKLLSSAEARITIYRDKAVITVSTAISNPQRKRFSVAHELGHFEMHRYRSSLFLCSSEDINEGDVKDVVNQLEREANEFAAALLLPGRLFQPLCDEEDPSLCHIGELAHKFDTSLTATALRYIRFTEAPVALVYSKRGEIKWVRQSDELKALQLFIHNRRRLDDTSIASRGLPMQRHVPADIWFNEGQFDKSAQIMEHSRQMPNYDAVMTLLWLDRDIVDDDD